MAAATAVTASPSTTATMAAAATPAVADAAAAAWRPQVWRRGSVPDAFEGMRTQIAAARP